MAWLYTPHPTAAAFKTDSVEDAEAFISSTDRPAQVLAKFNVLDNVVREVYDKTLLKILNEDDDMLQLITERLVEEKWIKKSVMKLKVDGLRSLFQLESE